MTWHCARCATTYFDRPLDGRCDECLQPLTEENMEPNALYAELDRLKRERDALADALKLAERAIGNHVAPEQCYATGPLTGDAYTDLVECPACVFLAALAQVRK